MEVGLTSGPPLRGHARTTSSAGPSLASSISTLQTQGVVRGSSRGQAARQRVSHCNSFHARLPVRYRCKLLSHLDARLSVEHDATHAVVNTTAKTLTSPCCIILVLARCFAPVLWRSYFKILKGKGLNSRARNHGSNAFILRLENCMIRTKVMGAIEGGATAWVTLTPNRFGALQSG